MSTSQLNEALLDACANPDTTLSQVEELIEAGADVKAADIDDGWTALMYAAMYSTNPKVISVLINAGADLEAVNKQNGWTPLMNAAAANSNPECASVLINAGADLEAKHVDDWTPLMVAARHSAYPEVVAVLTKAGANLEAKNQDDWTPLMVAARHSAYPEVVAVLTNAGAELEVKNEEDWTPLMIAARYGSDPKSASILIKAGANLEAKNDHGFTPLILAAAINSNPEVVSFLIKAGANLYAKTNEGKTALDHAKVNKSFDEEALKAFSELEKSESLLEACADLVTPPTTIETLIKEGANVAYVDENGFTPLHLAAKFSLQPRSIDILLKNGADIEARTNSGSTPLILAVAVNIHPGFTDILINHNADVNAKDNGGWSPIDFAVAHKNISSREERFEALKKAMRPSTGAFEINCIDPGASLGDTIRKLIKAGANIENTPEDGFTPIIRAAAQRQPMGTFEALLEHNPNLNARLPSKHHVIHYVAASCPLEILNTLNQHDPSSVKSLLEEKTDEGFTPILLAAANNTIDCIEGLIDLNASPLPLTFDDKNILDLAKSNENLSDDDRNKVEQYHADYVKTMAIDEPSVGGGAETVDIDPEESSASSNKYQCEKCGEKQHKGIYFGPYSDVEFIDVESGWYDLEEIQEAHSDVTAKIEEGNIYDDKTIAFAKGIDPIAEVQCSSCNEPIPVSLKQTLSDLANTIDRVSPFRGPTLRGRVVSNDHSNMTKGSSLIEGSSCKICNSKLRLTAVIPISVQEVGKESGDLTLGGGVDTYGSNITDDEHMEFTDGSTYSTHQTELDLVYSIQCTNSESVCWYMEYLTGKTLEDVLACAMQTEATPVAWLPCCRK